MISIITPILNEEGYVKTFLVNLNIMEGDFELILVDGGSTDRTFDEIQEFTSNFRHRLELLKTQKGRGNQMNKGINRERKI